MLTSEVVETSQAPARSVGAFFICGEIWGGENCEGIYCLCSFAASQLWRFMLTKGGDLDLGGKKHGALNAPAAFKLNT